MVLTQDLRDAVLQAALQGKLTEQLETDSSVELQSVDNEMLSNIPENWRLIEVDTIIEIRNGFTPKRTVTEFWDKQEIPWFTVEDINEQGHTITYTRQFITNKALGNSKTRKIPKHTVLLCCTSATIGNYALTEIELTTNQQWNGLVVRDAFKENVLAGYILCWVQTLKEEMIRKGGSTTFPFLSTKKLGKFLIPLPPIEEQQRIVYKINELMEKIDEYEKVENELIALEQRFPDDMKNALLQAAMQGKLTEQLDSDSSVDEMLEAIKEEKKQLIKEKKIKKEKALPPIDEDEIPFDIPQNWRWERFANIAILNPRNSLDDTLEVSFIPMTLISDGYNNEHTAENRIWKDVKKGFTHIKEGDLGFAKITPCFQNRKSVIFKNLVNGYAAGTTELHIIRTISNSILAEYLLWFVKSPYFIDGGVNTYTGTAGQQRIHKDYLPNCLVPVPPIEEQQRIVERLEQLLPLCETL